MGDAKSLAERCTAIELLVLDVDGVLTPGTIAYTDDGTELKTFHVRDGSAIKLWQRAGGQVAILSGRTSLAVAVRAAELAIDRVIQGTLDKLPALGRLLSETGMQPQRVARIGDDLPDLPLLHNCGLAVAVADACPEVLADAHYVTQTPGGRGAVREVVELLLRCQGKWQPFVERLRAERLSGE